MRKITPFLWFDSQAEEAMHFYTSIFKNSKAGRISRYGDAGPGPKGSVMPAGTRMLFTEQAVFLDSYDDAGSREKGTRALLDKLEATLR